MEGSGDVSSEEFAKWFEVFSLFDEDGSASISTSVLGHVVRGLDRMPTESLLKVSKKIVQGLVISSKSSHVRA